MLKRSQQWDGNSAGSQALPSNTKEMCGKELSGLGGGRHGSP